jgi:hypothetical protein
MSQSMIRFACLGALLFSLTACSDLPPDISPNYVRVPFVSPEPPHEVQYILVPENCLKRDPLATGSTLGETLPAGCANAYNLLHMAERKGDVEHGRPLGKASAARTAKAAQKYLNGTTGGTSGAAAPADSMSGGQMGGGGGSDAITSPANPMSAPASGGGAPSGSAKPKG